MKIKRFLSIVLTLAMLLGMFPGMSLTASAADTTTTITSPATTGTMTITLTIAAASVKTAPEANTLTYSGSAQTLTTTGEAGVGTLQYQLGESATTEPTGTWGTTVPQGTEAKDYYVWYRSRVNDNNISTAGCKTVTIAKASITNATVTLSDTSLVYNGLEQSVTVSSVKLGDTTLTADTDYEVTSGTTGTAKNTYTVTVTGKGNYKDTATAQWSIGLATPTIETFPTASAITYGQKLADSTLTGGVAKLGDTTVAGTFAWKNTETKPAVSDSNATEYDVVFTPTDSDNYAAVECKVKLTVNKAAPTVTAPTAKTLTYTGSAQELVNAGSTEDGTLYYAVTTENKAPTDENLNDTSIPTGTDAGTYYVWYKVVGDANHNSTEPNSVEAKINPVDKADLNTAIEEAEAYYESIKEDDVYAQVAEALRKAIDEAKKYTNNNVAEKEVKEAIDTIKAAKVDAEEGKKEADDTVVANEVTDAINALPASDKIATTDKEAIEAARKAYDALTDDQKAKVPADTLKKLEDAEKALEDAEQKEAEKEAADTEAAKKVTDAINALPASDKIATTDKEAIEAARKAYNALTDDQKAKVPADTLKKLEDAEKVLADAEKNTSDDDKKDEDKPDYKNEWVDGQWYGADGNAEYKAKGSWKQNDKGWWYEDTDGWYPKSQWQKINGKWYYFTADGYMDYSEYRDGYWLGSDGAWDETYSGGHWMQDSTGWWYVDATSWYPVNQYLWVDGVQYWFNANGYWE